MTTENKVVENILRKNIELGDNMRLYSKKNKEDLFDIFNIDINLPKFKWGTRPGNEWGNDYACKYLECMFNTELIYHSDETFRHFKLTLLGFGFSITRQTSY